MAANDGIGSALRERPCVLCALVRPMIMRHPTPQSRHAQVEADARAGGPPQVEASDFADSGLPAGEGSR